MLDSLKKEWRLLKEDRPGERFQARYRRARAGSRNKLIPIARLLGGLVIVAVGVVLMPAPGPGMLIVVLGLALAASDILWVARVLDWSEVRLRAALNRFRRWWRSASTATRLSLLGLAAALILAGGYGIVRYFLHS